MTAPMVYISGPITGVERYWEAFEAAEDMLREKGFIPFNPVTLPDGLTRVQYMSIELSALLRADAVLLLHNWNISDGGFFTEALADYCGIPAFESIETLCAAIPRPI